MRFSRRFSAGIGAFLLACAISHDATAASKSVALTTSVTITQACAITVTGMNFGNITAVTGTETTTSSAKVNCSAGTPYSVSFRAGAVQTSGFGNLAGPGGNIQVFVSLATSAGTSTGTHILNGKLTASPITTTGLYQNNFLIYVNY
jgi:spore coat protein U-like protein